MATPHVLAHTQTCSDRQAKKRNLQRQSQILNRGPLTHHRKHDRPVIHPHVSLHDASHEQPRNHYHQGEGGEEDDDRDSSMASRRVNIVWSGPGEDVLNRGVDYAFALGAAPVELAPLDKRNSDQWLLAHCTVQDLLQHNTRQKRSCTGSG